jgi:signal transduction histidine kinase
MISTGTAPPAKALRDAAHELNNLCATIIGFATLAEEADQPKLVATAYLTEIRLSTEAIAAIARQLRALSEELGKSIDGGSPAS